MTLNEEKFCDPQAEFRNRNCPACGTAATREVARFCRVCGKFLREDYQPLDAFRASHRLQGKSIRRIEETAVSELFAANRNAASATASAFVVYSLVPYLGVLFCPGAFIMGGIGAYAAYRRPQLGGRRSSLYSLVLSVIIFAAQILLWWLLYYIPELGKRI